MLILYLSVRGVTEKGVIRSLLLAATVLLFGIHLVNIFNDALRCVKEKKECCENEYGAAEN